LHAPVSLAKSSQFHALATSASWSGVCTGPHVPKRIKIAASLAGVTLAFVMATRIVNSAPGTDVVTYHNDNARTGQNLSETTLTLASVNASLFGKRGFITLDGKVDAQPLFASALSIPGLGARNVLFAVTEHDSVYALDADTGGVLWRTSTLGAGETTSDTRGCSQVTPEIGITSTPVIDRSRGPNGAIYVVAMSKTGSTYFQRLHALDLTTGAELFGGPKTITASYPGSGAGSSGGSVVFDPKQYEERSALTMLNGRIIMAWTSHCDIDPYTGWIMAYDANTLAQSSVLNITPNGSRGGFWMAGAGPAVDPQGNVYLLDGNGTFDTTLTGAGFPNQGNFGNAFLKIATSSGLAVADYFATFDTVAATNADRDLGSGGTLVLPDFVDGTGLTRHMAVGAGKDGHIYVVNRDAMGRFNPSSNQIYQDIGSALGGSVFSMPAYFNNTLYYGAAGSTLKAFSITSARLSLSPTSASANSFAYPGTTPGISAAGNTNGIVWAVENSSPAVLHAYDARDLTRELYNSNQAASGRDQFGAGNKFITPTIVNGQVFIGTGSGIAVFGVIAPPPPPTGFRIVQ
jgi:hypothetical protein